MFSANLVQLFVKPIPVGINMCWVGVLDSVTGLVFQQIPWKCVLFSTRLVRNYISKNLSFFSWINPEMEEFCSLSRLWQLQSVSHRQSVYRVVFSRHSFTTSILAWHTFPCAMKSNWAAVSWLEAQSIYGSRVGSVWMFQHRFNSSSTVPELCCVPWAPVVICSSGESREWICPAAWKSCVICLVLCLALEFNVFPAGMALEPF